MTGPKFSIIAAIDRDGGIGKGGGIPWHLPGDLKRFKEITTHAPDGRRNAVIMGRKTYASIPVKYRPLPGRHNVVMTRNDVQTSSATGSREAYDGSTVAYGFQEALRLAAGFSDIGKIFVIGGGEVYREALEHPSCEKLHLTLIDASFDCDTFFPPYPPRFVLADTSPSNYRESGLTYWYNTFQSA